jgi:hypothetical protein
MRRGLFLQHPMMYLAAAMPHLRTLQSVQHNKRGLLVQTTQDFKDSQRGKDQ